MILIRHCGAPSTLRRWSPWTELVSWSLSSFAVGVVQVRACRRKATRGVDTQGRRGRDTGVVCRPRRTPRGACLGGAKRKET
jgi:hypothetical protein